MIQHYGRIILNDWISKSKLDKAYCLLQFSGSEVRKASFGISRIIVVS